MPRLKLEALEVSSFDTVAQPVGGDTGIDTQQMDCWSPLCMDTFQRTCPQTG